VAYRLAEEKSPHWENGCGRFSNSVEHNPRRLALVAADASKDAIEIEVICSDPFDIADKWRLGRLTSMGYPAPRGKLYSNELTKTGYGLISYSTKRKSL
jgi:hypothetical protein